MPGVLEGIRILDLTQGPPGAMTTMLLADQGADVIKVEQPGGDPFRAIEPGYLVWDRSKRSITLDLNTQKDREMLKRLIGTTEVLVESFKPGYMASIGLDYQSLKGELPRLLYCSISAYGYDLPWGQDRPAIEGLVAARLGVPYIQAAHHRPGPVFHYWPVASHGTAFGACMGIGAALRARERTGRGQWIETSMHDGVSLMTAMDRQWMENPPPYFAQRMGNPKPYRPTMFECADGRWLHRMQTQKGNIFAIFEVLGYESPPLATGSRMDPADVKLRDLQDEMEIKAFKKRPMHEWVKLLRAADVPVEGVQTTEEAFQSEQAWANGGVAEVPHPEYGKVTQFGLGFRLSKTPGAIRPVHPRPGQHTAEVLKSLQAAPAKRAPAKPGRVDRLRHPLEGIKVLDFGHYVAGPFGPVVLGDMGAEVIKIEMVEGEHMRSPFQPFFAAQRGKRGLAVDMRTAEGLEIVYSLVKQADIVHHNHRPELPPKLKFDYETLKRLKPDLVYIHTPAYGVKGPMAHMGGYDQLFQAWSGLEMNGGGEGNPPIWYKLAALDLGGAMMSVVGGLLALYHRDRTGEGQFVDGSLMNASLFFNCDAFIAERGNPRKRPTLDRNQTGISATYRLYETAEEWVCVAALFPDEWDRFCRSVGRPDLAARPEYRTHFDRIERRYELGEIFEPIFKTKTAEEWFRTLDGNQVPVEICDKDYWLKFLRGPEYQQTQRSVKYYTADLGGVLHQFGKTVRFSDMSQIIHGPTPALGEHTREILGELGYSKERQEELKAKKIVNWPG